MSSCRGPVGCAGLKVGAAAAPPEATAGIAAGEFGCSLGACGSGSRMSAPSPRPNAFLGIGDYLLGKLCITLSALAVHVIENNWLTKARCFRQTNVPRD